MQVKCYEVLTVCGFIFWKRMAASSTTQLEKKVIKMSACVVLKISAEPLKRLLIKSLMHNILNFLSKIDFDVQ